MCFTEEQKREIEKSGMMVIEFKRVALRLKEIGKMMAAMVETCIAAAREWARQWMGEVSQTYKAATPKQRYKIIKKLDRCGFTEKEINLMVNCRCMSGDNC